MSELVDRWFETEVLPLEGRLTRYLRRMWRDPAEIDDLRQEIYVRVYESAHNRIPPAAGPHLFAVARNLLIDRLRRARLVPIDHGADLARLNVITDEVDAERVLSGREEIRRLQEIVAILPPRCREVFRLRKVLGQSQKEVAATLGIAESTVEKQLAKAMRVLAAQFYGGGGGEAEASAATADTHETGVTGRG